MEKVERILKGHNNPIRNLEQEEASTEIYLIILAMSKMHCGMREDENLTQTIQFAAKFVYEKFKMIGVNEIQEAFNLASANEFPGIDMKAYFGIFTISMLGDILDAYRIYRAKIIQKIQDEIDLKEKERIFEEEKERKNEEARQKAIYEIKTAIEMAQNGKCFFETWEDIPIRYGEIAVKEGIITPSKEFKIQVMNEARQIELNRTRNDLMNTEYILEAKKLKLALKNIIELSEMGLRTSEADRIYSKLILWHFVKPI